MKWASYRNATGIVVAVICCAAAVGPYSKCKNTETVLNYINLQTDSFSHTVHQLKLRIDEINPKERPSIRPVIEVLKSCRRQYKKISFFLDYFYPQQEKLFNAPAKEELEEPYMEYEDSQSFQQMESILYGPGAWKNKKALQNLAIVLDESAADLKAIYFDYRATDAQLAESLHLELIRIMTLYITGYDAPELKTGILETRSSLESISYMSGLLFQPGNAEARLLDSLGTKAIGYTMKSDFDHFDRLGFLTLYAIPLEEQLIRCTRLYDLQLSGLPHYHQQTGNLFRAASNESAAHNSVAQVELGEKLFGEKALSGNYTRSCASCHQPGKYFTDGLVANRKINSAEKLRRNTPTLLYAACQPAQFWDGRASTLPEQISDVLSNPDEMNVSILQIKQRLSQKETYRSAFHDSFTLIKMEDALSAYLHTLQPMNSAFDRYMAGDHRALSAAQKKGFNLFMGKGHCGSCHFAPVFNGSTPPFFNRSEYEVLGVPGVSTSGHDIPDADLGRFQQFPVPLYKRAFKTPTVRNTAQTGPYMHNGRFKSLQEVLDFYNRGGGAGIGIHNQEQTLSEKPLHLSAAEITDIIAFLNALTDDLRIVAKPHYMATR